MRNTLQEQYNLIKEGKGNKQQFFKSARHLFPNLITPVNTLNDAVTILKNKGIISEMFVGGGVVTKGKTPDWFSIFKENITEYGEDSGGQDMTYGMYNRSSARKNQGIQDFINKGKEDYYDDVPYEACPYEDGYNKYYKADLAKLWQMGWKEAEISSNEENITELSGKFGSKEEVTVINNKTGKKAKAMITSTSMSTGTGIEYNLKYSGEKPNGFPDTIKDDDLDSTYSLKRLTEAKEAKAEEKETTKEVTDMATRGYDYKDTKNIDNIFGTAFLKGFYSEMQDPKNEDKTVEELKQIVAKNLAKDCLHYVKNSPFGVEGAGYSVEAPGLGEPKPAKGKHKSSGYGDLKESVLRSQIHLLVKEVLAESKISEDQFEKALKMHKKGKSPENIAKELKIDPVILKNQLKKYKEEKENLKTSDKG